MASGQIKGPSRWGTPLAGYTFPFTATRDGLAIVDIARNTSGACYMYVNDSTAGYSVAKDTTATNDFTLTFPVISGHRYVISAQSNIASYGVRIFPLQ